jgi:hypothetical protein
LYRRDRQWAHRIDFDTQTRHLYSSNDTVDPPREDLGKTTMTTLVTLATKDAVVLGCDSLATTSKPLLDPVDMLEFFDPDNDWRPRVNEEGQSALNFWQLVDRARRIPLDHMTDIDKLTDLSPLPMGCMFTGITSIGERTIKSLISEFVQRFDPRDTRVTSYTVEEIARGLLAHLSRYYEQVFSEQRIRPGLELLLGGYGSDNPLPEVYTFSLHDGNIETCNSPGVTFAGVVGEIQRIVFGIDTAGILHLEQRYRSLLEFFSARTQAINPQPVVLPDIEAFMHDGFHLFDPFDLPALDANWGDFSDQNAIDCVAWFIGIMREAHRFNSKMPTVGGPIHIGLITKESGFKFISREEYRHEDHRVQRVLPRTRRP